MATDNKFCKLEMQTCLFFEKESHTVNSLLFKDRSSSIELYSKEGSDTFNDLKFISNGTLNEKQLS